MVKAFHREQGVDHTHRADRLADIVDTNHVHPLCHRERRRRDAPGKAFAGSSAAEPLDERFSRDANDDWMAEGHNPIQVSKEREVVLRGLAEAHSGVERNRVRREPRRFQGANPIYQKRRDLSDHVLVLGVGLHRLRVAEHVHRDDSRPEPGNCVNHRGFPETGDIVHDRRSGLEGLRRDLRLHRVD